MPTRCSALILGDNGRQVTASAFTSTSTLERPFAGRVALVTGGAGAIGRATAQALAARGATVFAADIGNDRCIRVAKLELVDTRRGTFNEKLDGDRRAAPNPWSARAPMSQSIEGAAAEHIEPMPNKASPPSNARRCPAISVKRPPRTRKPANVSAVAETIQESVEGWAPNDRPMVGNATLTMEKSVVSTS